MKSHVALTGFMAAGKSTIGKKVARATGVPFYDLDDAVVDAHGSIDEIFYTQGEARFREYERDALETLLAQPPGIISLGGGAVTADPTLKLLKKRTYRVFVKVPAEQIVGRLRRSKRVRPLLGPVPSLSRVRELYSARMPRYAHADLTIDAAGLRTAQVVEQIATWIAHKRIFS